MDSDQPQEKKQTSGGSIAGAFTAMIPFFIMLYYRIFYYQCGSPLDDKIDEIMKYYYIIIGLIIFEVCCPCLCCCTIISAGARLVMTIMLLIMVQKGYSASPEWPNCGHWHGMTLIWLILNYLSIFLICLVLCCSCIGICALGAAASAKA